MDKIRFAIPKGSLEVATFEILERALFKISGQDRTYRPTINDPDILLKVLRPQEIPTFVAEGSQDIGITGKDWIRETSADVETLIDLEYGHTNLVLAVPQSNQADSLRELLSSLKYRKKPFRISTEYLNITQGIIMADPSYRKMFGTAEPFVVTPWWKKGKNQAVSLFLSFGATEAKPPEDADAIVDLTATGTTMVRNGLKIVETFSESSAVLVGNRKSLANVSKREKIFDLIALLRGVVDGRKKLHVFVNVRSDRLQRLLRVLPSLKNPTISPLADKNWYSVNTVIDRENFVRILPQLRRLAQGLVVHEPRQILPLEELASNRIKGKRR